MVKNGFKMLLKYFLSKKVEKMTKRPVNVDNFNTVLTQPILKKIVELYSNAKIVLNLPREDYKVDANTRCFEGMAAGCLLITPKKSELNHYGFIPGKDYIEYLDEKDLTRIIEMVIKHPEKYKEIASRGKLKTKLFHNYDNLTKVILNDFENYNEKNNNFKKVLSIAIYFARKLYQNFSNFILNWNEK